MSFNILSSYIEIIDKILRFILSDIYGIKLKPENKTSIDERLAKIDIAKTNLSEALKAIDEIKTEAESNKKESENTVRKLASSDIESFRKVAGILSPSQIKRERIIGFVSGVIASIVASGLVWLIVKIFYQLFPNVVSK